MRAFIIVDLGFGDAGKGHLTDYLVRQHQAGVVVRYNGGAQAGHNVVTPEGRHHTFSQFGSGTFVPGVKTFLTKDVVIHPSAILVEGHSLQQKGVPDVFSRLRISENALVITPFHQAANRILELSRGTSRHGSCGVGVGQAIEDARAFPVESVYAADLYTPPLLSQKLELIRERKLQELTELLGDRLREPSIAREWEVFTDPDLSQLWIESLEPIIKNHMVAPDSLLADWLHQTDAVVYEGAQGMLLDADFGFHPYTTWSNCSTANAVENLRLFASAAEAQTIGITRCYMVRHGPGPLPTETAELAPLVTDHNQRNAWQGGVRYGWLDAVLLNYALRHSGNVDCLALTHLDLLPKLQSWKVCTAYGDPAVQTALNLPGPLDHARRFKLTDALMQADPTYHSISPSIETVIKVIEELTEVSNKFISIGQVSSHVYLRNVTIHN